jgi:hypothetical protein
MWWLRNSLSRVPEQWTRSYVVGLQLQLQIDEWHRRHADWGRRLVLTLAERLPHQLRVELLQPLHNLDGIRAMRIGCASDAGPDAGSGAGSEARKGMQVRFELYADVMGYWWDADGNKEWSGFGLDSHWLPLYHWA